LTKEDKNEEGNSRNANGIKKYIGSPYSSISSINEGRAKNKL